MTNEEDQLIRDYASSKECDPVASKYLKLVIQDLDLTRLKLMECTTVVEKPAYRWLSRDE